MKKSLLFLLLPAIAVSGYGASSPQPQIYFGEALSAISPDGNWLAGQIADGSVIIRNLSTDEYWLHISDGGNKNYYIGHGTATSDIGVIVGSTTTSNAAYWENGVWRVLPTPNPGWISNAVSITPDGSVICGGIGGAEIASDTESCMLLPALWYRQENGTYGSPVLLPHPDLDITGRAPQYITAITISDDGQTVGGQLMDYYGGRCEPIVYRCDDTGKWSYTLLGRDLLNPNDIQFPEWPGSLPDDILMPTQEWFMTQEQIDAFVEAFNEWDYSYDAPRYEDFMTPEQIEAYRKALQEYLDIAVPWSEKYEAFMNVYRQYVRTAVSFVFNNGRISPDGRFFVMSGSGLNNIGSYSGGLKPVVFDLSNDSYSIVNSRESVNINYISADYTLLGFTGAAGDVGTRKAYVFPQMKDEGLLLEDYMKEKNPEVYNWMEEKLVQDVIIGIGTNNLYETEEMFCTGIPVGTPDLKYILTANTTASWLDDPGEDFVSVLLPTTKGSAEDNYVNAIEMEFTPERYDIYDLSGNLVVSARTISDDIISRLPKGIFISKAVAPDGVSRSFKFVK